MKQNSIRDVLPEGLVVNRDWLTNHGFKRPLVDYYLRSGALKPVARGAYRRPGPNLKWEHIAHSLQELGFSIHVGGRSALELQGYAHYLPLQGIKQIDLYGVGKLPSWINNLEASYKFILHKTRLFKNTPSAAITTKPFGHWDWPINFAKPELALLQLAAEVERSSDFDVLEKFFESAATLRPQLIMKLLMSCDNVKAKRLFLWFSERKGFSWFKHLDKEAIDLGSGKRVIEQGGALDKTYQITIPRKMADEKIDGFNESFL